MHEVTGLDANIRLKGGLDIVSKLMRQEGMQRLRSYLASHPPKTEIQRRRVLAAFLDKYAIEEEIEEEIDLPGWTEAIVSELTESYEDDLAEISRLPGVNFISP